jgi:hypothetical protein
VGSNPTLSAMPRRVAADLLHVVEEETVVWGGVRGAGLAGAAVEAVQERVSVSAPREAAPRRASATSVSVFMPFRGLPTSATIRTVPLSEPGKNVRYRSRSSRGV